MLLEHGANACAENSKCQTPLHVGVLRYGVVRMLLEHGANTCAEDIEHQILGPVALSRRNGSAVGTGYESGFSGSGGSLALILGIALFFISRCDNAIWNHALGSGVWRRVASKSRKYLASTFMALTIILGSCLLRYFFDNLAFTMSLYTYSCTLSCFTLCTYSFL